MDKIVYKRKTQNQEINNHPSHTEKNKQKNPPKTPNKLESKDAACIAKSRHTCETSEKKQSKQLF